MWVVHDAALSRRFVIDGNKVIVQREEPEKKVEEVTFEANEVYAIDICFSSGEGKVRVPGARQAGPPALPHSRALARVCVCVCVCAAP